MNIHQAPWKRRFYNGKQWRNCRASFIAERQSIDGGICQECKLRPGLIVHHIKHLTERNHSNQFISLNHKNLKYVCKACHDRYDGHGVRKQKENPPCLFDDHGMPIPNPIDTPH